MSEAQHPNTPADPCLENPYPGLRPYEEDEQDSFGRDDDTRHSTG
ncbi:MAG: hypothetical protein R3E95_16565 [Thiolinea sp.]